MAYGGSLWFLYKTAVLGEGEAEAEATNLESQGEMTEFNRERNKRFLCSGKRERDTEKETKEFEIKTNRKAFLFCVMGGRFSEGVNFSDALARLVVVVGLPFPSINDKIFLLHKQYYDAVMRPQTKTTTTEPATGGGESSGGRNTLGYTREEQQQQPLKQQQHVDYGLLQCMTTVNQTIGRAIRHSKDYAAILLLDERYTTPRIQQLLPRWVQQNLAILNPASDHQTVGLHSVLPQGVDPDDQEEGGVIAQRLMRFFEPLEKESETFFKT